MSTTSLPVIAAVDGSDDSLRALEWALEEARLHDATVRVVHVRQYAAWTQPALLVPGPPPEPADDLVVEQVRSALEAREGLPPLEYLSVEGAPGVALPEMGSTAQLMVLGSRGRGGFASLLLGSNGVATARDADCPVVVVPRPGREVHGEGPAEPGPRVVVGVSVDAPDEHTLAFAFEEAARRRSRLEVVSAYPWPVYGWTAAGDFTPTAAQQEDVEREMNALVNDIVAPHLKAHPDVRVELRVAPGDAAGNLVAASKDADLVVVGRHRRRLLRPARMLGSVTQAVLLHAAAPVAVVPPDTVEEEQPEG